MIDAPDALDTVIGRLIRLRGTSEPLSPLSRYEPAEGRSHIWSNLR